MNELRQEAEKLRTAGYSYNMIRDKLGISLGTMSYWFKNKPFTPNHEVIKRIQYGPLRAGTLRHNQRMQEIAEMKEVGIKEVGTLSERDVWMFGLGLFIGEGAKTVEIIRIANSDPVVIVAMVRWLNRACNIPEENITIRIHLYPDSDEEKAIRYWQDVTGIPRENFRRTQFDMRQNKKRSSAGKLPYGTAHLTVVSRGDPNKGTKLFRRVNGWIAGVLKQM
jgi:hypothetical protein